MANANVIFSEVFVEIPKIPFNKEWSNGTGYFDNGVYGEHAPKLNPGQLLGSETPGGRRLIFIGTRLGNVVVFDRFTESAPANDNIKNAKETVFVTNTKTSFSQGGWIENGALTSDNMTLLLGDSCFKGKQNIGWRIEQIYASCKLHDMKAAVAA